MATHHDTMPRSANEERPNTPEQTSKWSRKKKILAGSIAVASVSAVAPVAAFFAMARGGESEPTPERSPAASSTPNPGETQTEQVDMSEQELRESLTYGTEYEYFVDPKYYAEVAQNGGIDRGVEDSYINEDYAQQVIQTLLTNKVVALETGNEDALLATYHQVAPGDYGEMSGSVESIRSQAEYLKSLQEQDPSFPVGSMQLTSIADITPDPTDKNIVEFAITVDNVSYGQDIEGNLAKYHTVEDQIVILERDDEISGWSDGGTRANWGIKFEQIVNIDDMPE